MDLISIKTLLDKYFEGNTSIVEEKLLRDYFNSNQEVPSELQYAKDIFCYLSRESEEMTDTTVKIGNRVNKKRLLIGITSIAAGIMLLGGLYFYSNRPAEVVVYGYINGKPITDKQYAMAETKRALLLISDNLNYGTRDLDYLTKLNVVDQLISKNK